MLSSLFYTSTLYFSTFVNVVSNFLVRLWIVAAAFGAHNFTSTFINYFNSYNGIYANAIEREVPKMLGQGRNQEADNFVEVTYTLLFLSMILEFLFFAILGFISKELYLRLAWWTSAVVCFCTGFSTLDRINLKSHLQFDKHNRALFWGSFGNGLIIIISSWMFGVYGYFFGLAGGALWHLGVFQLLSGRKWSGYLRISFQKNIVKQILLIGFLIGFLRLLTQIMLTSDRFIILHYLSLTELGYYSLGSAITAVLYLLPQSIAGFYFPRMMMLVGSGKFEQMRLMCIRLQKTNVILSGITITVILLFVKPVVSFFLPTYKEAIPAFEVMCLTGYFLGCQAPSYQLHIGLGYITRASVFAAIGCGLAVMFCIVFTDDGLFGVSTGMFIAVGFYALIVNLSGDRILRNKALRESMTIPSLVGIFPPLLFHLYATGKNIAIPIIYIISYLLFGIMYLSRLHAIDWRLLLRRVNTLFS